MGLREDLEDLCAGIAAASNTSSSKQNSLEENVDALLALKSRYKVEDTETFASMFEEAASASLWSLPSSRIPHFLFNFLKLEPPLQSVFFSLLLELGLQDRLKTVLHYRFDHIEGPGVSTLSLLLTGKPHLFNRDLLVFLQAFGKRYAEDSKFDKDSRKICGESLSRGAAQARMKAVLLRIALKDTPEIAEHGDEITTRLTALGADAALIETLRLAVVAVAPHSSEAVLASSVDRSRAFLEEMLRFSRRLLESKGHVPQVAKDPVTAKAILDSLQGVLVSQETELFQKFFNFASVSGAHTTSALLNQARLVRNTVVELTYYFLEKLRQEYGIG